jgi:hypothetical protein
MPSRYSASRWRSNCALFWYGAGAGVARLACSTRASIWRRACVTAWSVCVLQRQFADEAQVVAVFGGDAEAIERLDAIRRELALVERDLAVAAQSR